MKYPRYMILILLLGLLAMPGSSIAQPAGKSCDGRVTAINSSSQAIRIYNSTYFFNSATKVYINGQEAEMSGIRPGMYVMCVYEMDDNRKRIIAIHNRKEKYLH